jgi:hypothetical protein
MRHPGSGMFSVWGIMIMSSQIYAPAALHSQDDFRYSLPLEDEALSGREPGWKK